MGRIFSGMCGVGDEFVTVQLFSTDSAGIGSCQMPTSTLHQWLQLELTNPMLTADPPPAWLQSLQCSLKACCSKVSLKFI